MHAQEPFPEDAFEFSAQARTALAEASPGQFDDLTASLWEVIEIGMELDEVGGLVDRPENVVAVIRQFFASDSSTGLLSTCPTVIAYLKKRRLWGLRVEFILFRQPIFH